MKGFQQIHTPDLELKQVQENVRKAIQPLLEAAINDGVLVKSVALLAGRDNAVVHGLSRSHRLWIVVGIDANSVVWEKSSPAPESILNLWCSADCTVNLWVA